MEELNVIGRAFSHDTVFTKEDDGSWKVVVSMIEKRLITGDTEWEEKKVTTMCTNNDSEKAYSTALDATLRQFEAEINENKNGSLFPDGPKNEELVEEKKEAGG